jgi:hypothetical protein
VIIDIAIAITLLIAVWVGYQKGVVQPLLVEIFFLGTLAIIVRDRQAFTSALNHYLHANPVLDVFLALIVALVAGFIGGQLGGMVHRMPVVRGVDGFLGIFVHAGFVLLVAYLLLSALVTLDKAFAPTLAAATLTANQVTSLRTAINSNPITASLVDDRDLAKLLKDSKTPAGAHITTVPQLDQLQSIYEQFLQPQLAGSRTAPFIMRIGQHIPVIGHAGPKDLPAKPTPAPAASPTPKASPTR